MPGCFHLSVDEVAREAEEVEKLGIAGVILFGLPGQRPVGSEAYADDGIVQRAVRAIKQTPCRSCWSSRDVCLCEYTVHGHCGVVADGEVKNDPTLDLLARHGGLARRGRRRHRRAVGHDGRARRGDPRGARRRRLRGRCRSCPMRRSTPPRSTGRSARRPTRAPQFGDRRGYQMDPANAREALREVRPRLGRRRRHRDGEAGAGLSRHHPRVREGRSAAGRAPTTSAGESAMVKAAAANGWIDERRGSCSRCLTSIHRAGADMIITYHARATPRASAATPSPHPRRAPDRVETTLPRASP